MELAKATRAPGITWQIADEDNTGGSVPITRHYVFF